MKRLIGLSSWVCKVAASGASAVVLALPMAAAGTLVAAPAHAADLRIAVVNYAQLVQESPQAQAANASLRAEFSPKERSLQAEANELKARETALKKNEATMTQDQRDQAEVDLRERYQALAQKQSEIQDDVNARRNELMSELQHTLVQVVQRYAKEQRYDLVLADGVIYADNALDITPAILTALKSQPVRRAPAGRTH
ncbi:MAG: OmpH family outer membrane protein [Steroidobacteraceae bacterium]